MTEAPSPLPPWFDQLRNTLVFDRTAPCAELRDGLLQVASFDREMESTEAVWKKRTGMTGCTAALMIPAGIVTLAAGLLPLPILAAIVFVGCLIGAIYCGVHWYRYSRLNLENRRYQLAVALLRYLSIDMAPDAPLHLRIDFNSYLDNRFLRREDKGGFFSNTAAYAYAVPWLSVGGKLADGNRFELSLTMLVKRKTRRKRKYTKIREAFRERMALTIQVKPQKFPALASLPARVEAVQLKGPQGPLSWRVSDQRVVVSCETSPALRAFGRGQSVLTQPPNGVLCQIDDVLKFLLTAYEGLALCRTA